MGALTQARQGIKQSVKVISLPLDASQKAFRGGMACADLSTGGVKPGQSSTTLVRIGTFGGTTDIDNSAGTTTVQVMVVLDHELVGDWWDNATGGNKVLAADMFTTVYILDDHTVTKATSGNSKAGRVWGVDSVKGVFVVSEPGAYAL